MSGYSRRWTAEEDALLLAGATSADLDRTPRAIACRRRHLAGKTTRTDLMRMPQGRSGWLIAKTCRGCGELLPAEAFSKDGKGRHYSNCGPCHNRRGRDWKAENPDLHHEQTRRWRYKVQSKSLEGATNHYKEWTGPELEVVTRRELSDAQVAEILGRTAFAIKGVRQSLRRDPRKQRMAGLPGGEAAAP